MELFFFIYLACEDVSNIVLNHKFLKGFLRPEVPALIPVVKNCHFRFSGLLFFYGQTLYTPIHTHIYELRKNLKYGEKSPDVFPDFVVQIKYQ